MQIAFYIGCREVVLIGVDHNFTDKGIPYITELCQSEDDPNHFLPNLRRSEMAYELAKTTFENVGRWIVDATREGKCQVFEKVNYLSLF